MPESRIGPLRVGYDDRVLAPRPWTLAQATWGAEIWADGPVLELCSGVGHIGLSLALRVPARVVMVDADPIACAFAAANAQTAGLADRVDIRCAELGAALAARERYPLILADPPWVPSAETGHFPEDPPHAIDGGPDGSRLTRACLEVIARHLTADGQAILQVGPGQMEALEGQLADLRLTVHALRQFGDRGELVGLSRRG